MKTASLPTIGTLDTTLPTPGDPSYQQEALSLTIHQTIKNLSDAGFQFQASETSDFSTFATDVADGVDDYTDRLGELLSTGTSAIVANIPDIISIVGPLLAGGGSAIVPLLLQGVLDVLLRQFDVRADVANGEPGGQIDLVGIEERLDNIETAIHTIMNTFTVNIIGDLQSQTWSAETILEE